MHPQPCYITTPIYYVNDRPHIGHCYTTTLADVLARAHRLLGRDVYFLTGTDEHADKVVAAAREHGLTPRQWADQCSTEFRKAFARLDLAPDVFYRTSDLHHKTAAAALIAVLKDKNDIYLGDYVGWYDASQDEYLTETVAKESGFNSPVTGKPLEKRTEKNYFFRLSKYQGFLEAHYAAHPGFVLPEARRNEVLGRLRTGLQDVPVSRAIRASDPDWGDWGVTMPGDPGHRVYVWIEALCNYLTAVEREDPGPGAGLNPEGAPPASAHVSRGDLRRYWPATVHLMAKDILWFHAVVWPAMLHALGRALPVTVYAHAYYVRDGRKMSKSLGNFIEIDLVGRYCDKFSPDAVRWYLCTQGPLGATDADFSHTHFVETFNADLANGIGNCASRVGNMLAKYFEGRVPDLVHDGRFDHAVVGSSALTSALSAREKAGNPVAGEARARTFDLSAQCAKSVSSFAAAAGGAQIDAALREGMSIVRSVDDFISHTAPFTLAKKMHEVDDGPIALASILYACAEAVRIASLLLFPACPSKMAALWRTWNCSILKDPSDINSGFVAPLSELSAWGGAFGLKPLQAVAKGDILFMRADPGEGAP